MTSSSRHPLGRPSAWLIGLALVACLSVPDLRAAVGMNADTDYATRGSIPGSGDAARLCDGGFKNTFQGVWVYRPSATATYALSAGADFINGISGAREIQLGFNSAGSTLADLDLTVTFNSGGGAGATQSFASHAGDDFLDTWVYYFILDNSTSGQIAGYVTYADKGSTITESITRANDNATSQFINTLYFGNRGGGSGILGYYAYGRARFATGITTSDVLTWSDLSTTASGDWGFWPLDIDTDSADDSGNGRDLTFGGTMTTQTSPTLGGGGAPSGAPRLLLTGVGE